MDSVLDKYLQLKKKKKKTLKKWLTEMSSFIFYKLASTACGIFDYRSVLHHFRGGNTPAHRQGPMTMTGLLHTRNTLPHTHTHNNNTDNAHPSEI